MLICDKTKVHISEQHSKRIDSDMGLFFFSFVCGSLEKLGWLLN